MIPGSEFREMLDAGSFDMPSPGCGQTAIRHRRLAAIARKDLTLGRLAEAHCDAVAILNEAGWPSQPGALYGVWASEIPGRNLRLVNDNQGFALSGVKMFCTGATIVDRVLITVTEPERRLIDLDLRAATGRISYDESEWVTGAFSGTHTATTTFSDVAISREDLIGEPDWYLSRSGFWHGACGPASCWAGGAMRLLDYAQTHTRQDNPHAMAHLGAIAAAAWGLESVLDAAGHEIDADPDDPASACTRALKLRYLVEAACTEMLVRFGRAYGPRPLAFDELMSRHCQELTLYIRQSHAECDLETLGRRCHGKG
jgi:hypothetical protein